MRVLIVLKDKFGRIRERHRRDLFRQAEPCLDCDKRAQDHSER